MSNIHSYFCDDFRGGMVWMVVWWSLSYKHFIVKLLAQYLWQRRFRKLYVRCSSPLFLFFLSGAVENGTINVFVCGGYLVDGSPLMMLRTRYSRHQMLRSWGDPTPATSHYTPPGNKEELNMNINLDMLLEYSGTGAVDIIFFTKIQKVRPLVHVGALF